jgi:hypothetical protein
MRIPVTTAAVFWSLAATAAAQSGVQITMPPNARQEGQVPFANNCPTAQTFKVSAEPQTRWLHFEPSTVDVSPNTSFGLRVTLNTAGNLAAGKYRTSLKVVCMTCPATDPPCLQDAKELAIGMTVANVKKTGPFEAMTVAAPAPAPAVFTSPETEPPQPFIPPDEPSTVKRSVAPLIGGIVLVIGAIGILVAVRGMVYGRPMRAAGAQSGAESERHQVRR